MAAALTDRLRRRRFWDHVLDGAPADAVLRGDAAAAKCAMQAALVAAAGSHQDSRLGKVTLVGAGPGVLQLARRDAARADVGKRCGRHVMSQAAISALLLRHVRPGCMWFG